MRTFIALLHEAACFPHVFLFFCKVYTFLMVTDHKLEFIAIKINLFGNHNGAIFTNLVKFLKNIQHYKQIKSGVKASCCMLIEFFN